MYGDLSDPTTFSNAGVQGGGALYVLANKLTLADCYFASNTAPKGGAIYARSGTLYLYGVYFASSNQASDSGQGESV